MTMRPLRCLPLLAILVAAAGCSTPSPGPRWEPLFNGRDLSGWTVKCKPA